MRLPKDGSGLLAENFKQCRQILLAVGYENRQHLILEMIKMGKCGSVPNSCAFGSKADNRGTAGQGQGSIGIVTE